MKNHIKPKLLFVVLFALSVTSNLNAQSDKNWQIFDLNSLSYKKRNVFLNTETIAAKVEITTTNYTLKVSKYDRVLFVVEGTSSITIANKKVNLKINDVLFLKANEDIAFNEELKLLTWVCKSVNTKHDLKTQVFSEETITEQRDANENVWNRFINTTSLALGLYMLPKSLDGDQTLNHQVDEINFVRNGTAKFKMNDTVIDVKPGSIMYVKRGVGHYFYDLSDDFDVYILFEKETEVKD